MAFGPSTDIFQQAIQLLMQGRGQTPLAPAPSPPMTIPTFEAPPSPAPVAPAPALDQSLIEQLTGPRPVAPTPEPTSLIIRIARALQGFGAGVQGQGPQFLETLRRQREEPIERFKAESQIYEDRRRRATEIAENKRQGEQADIQRRADIQSNREFQIFETQQRDRMQEARDLRQQAAALEREEVKAKAEQRELEAAREKQRRAFEHELATKDGAPPKIAREISEYRIGMRDALSPAAEKWRGLQAQKVQAQIDRLERSGGGTGTGGGADKQTAKLVAEFNAARENLITVVARGDKKGEEQLRLRLNQLVRRLAGRPGVEAGYGAGQWPYVKVNGVLSTPETGQQQPTAQAAAPQNQDPLGIR